MPQSPVSKRQNDINRQLNRYFGLVIIALLVLFLLAAYGLVLWPKITQAQATIQANLEQQQNLYRLSRQRLLNLQTLAEVYSQVSPTDLQKFNLVLPERYPPEKLFGELEEIAKRGAWLIGSIAWEDEAELNDSPSGQMAAGRLDGLKLGRINIDLQVTAINYSGLKNLIKMLETNLRIFDIQEIDFSPSDNNAGIRMTTYYYQSQAL